jgi:hypothetical protein
MQERTYLSVDVELCFSIGSVWETVVVVPKSLTLSRLPSVSVFVFALALAFASLCYSVQINNFIMLLRRDGRCKCAITVHKSIRIR